MVFEKITFLCKDDCSMAITNVFKTAVDNNIVAVAQANFDCILHIKFPILFQLKYNNLCKKKQP